MKQYLPDVVALDKDVDEDDDTAEQSIMEIAILILDCNFVATQLTEVPNFSNPYHSKTKNDTLSEFTLLITADCWCTSMNGNSGCTKRKSEIIYRLYIKSTRLMQQYSPDVVALDKGVDEDDDTA